MLKLRWNLMLPEGKRNNLAGVCILILSISETNVNFNQSTQCTRGCHLKGVTREMLE